MITTQGQQHTVSLRFAAHSAHLTHVNGLFTKRVVFFEDTDSVASFVDSNLTRHYDIERVSRVAFVDDHIVFFERQLDQTLGHQVSLVLGQVLGKLQRAKEFLLDYKVELHDFLDVFGKGNTI